MLSAAHDKKDLDFAIDAFVAVARELGIQEAHPASVWYVKDKYDIKRASP